MKSRPPTGERRDISLPIRMNETEHTLLAHAADVVGMNLSHFMFNCAFIQATKIMKKNPETLEKAMWEIVKQNEVK